MNRKLWIQIKNFQPPLVRCCLCAVLFSLVSLLSITTDLEKIMAPGVVYCVDVCAALFLSLATWSIVQFFHQASLRHRWVTLAHRYAFTSRIMCDFSFRTILFTYASFALNILCVLAKGVAGWFSTSWWLISLSAYYITLCILKFLLLQSNRQLTKLKNQALRVEKEWKAYRICGLLFLVMTLVLFGVVILIVREGNQFTYGGTLIFVVALYDFYCLISSLISIVRVRKQHTPMIVAIKMIGFATALVSMLSLQTAMFASFGLESDVSLKNMMNLISGSSVCLILLFMGLFMIVHATKKIKGIHMKRIKQEKLIDRDSFVNF